MQRRRGGEHAGVERATTAIAVGDGVDEREWRFEQPARRGAGVFLPVLAVAAGTGRSEAGIEVGPQQRLVGGVEDAVQNLVRPRAHLAALVHAARLDVVRGDRRGWALEPAATRVLVEVVAG